MLLVLAGSASVSYVNELLFQKKEVFLEAPGAYSYLCHGHAAGVDVPRWAQCCGTNHMAITPICRCLFSPWSDLAFLLAGVPI